MDLGNKKVGIASRIINNKGTVGDLGITSGNAQEILDGFVENVLLDNWDAVGLGLENVVVLSIDDAIARIDQGVPCSSARKES